MVARVTMMTAVLLTALLVQTVVVPTFDVLGWRADVVTLTVVGLALADGPPTGIRYGFAAGLASDLLSGAAQLVGLSALVLLTVGYAAGLARRYLGSTPLGGQFLVAGAASALSLGLHGVLGILLDAQQSSGGAILQGMLVVGLYNLVLSPLVLLPLGTLARRFPGNPAAGASATPSYHGRPPRA
jgi:rod shape-determining protein MreD